MAFTVRGGLDDWLGGKVSGAKIGDVFGAGPTLQLDVGLLVMRVVELYAGWQRGFYGVGSASPYALYAHASARGDYYMVGARMVCERPIGLMLDGDFGYLDFHSGASDGLGGSAAVDLPTLGLRVGAALCIRPIKQLLVAPGLYSIMAFSTGSYRSSLTTGGTTDATSGSVAGGSPYVGVSPGLWITGQLPF